MPVQPDDDQSAVRGNALDDRRGVPERQLGGKAPVVSQAGRLLPGATRPAAGELRLPLLIVGSRFAEQDARCREGADGQQAVSDGRDDAGCLVWRQLGAVEVHAVDPGQVLGEGLGRGRPGWFRGADGDIGRWLYAYALAGGGVPEFQPPGFGQQVGGGGRFAVQFPSVSPGAKPASAPAGGQLVSMAGVVHDHELRENLLRHGPERFVGTGRLGLRLGSAAARAVGHPPAGPGQRQPFEADLARLPGYGDRKPRPGGQHAQRQVRQCRHAVAAGRPVLVGARPDGELAGVDAPPGRQALRLKRRPVPRQDLLGAVLRDQAEHHERVGGGHHAE